MLFDDPSNKQRATRRVADIFKCEYSQIYKAVSRPRVNESIEQNFIKVILTKDQKRDKGNKG